MMPSGAPALYRLPGAYDALWQCFAPDTVHELLPYLHDLRLKFPPAPAAWTSGWLIHEHDSASQGAQ